MAKQSQIQKFRETARAVEADESEKRFDDVLKAVAKKSRVPNPVNSGDSSPVVTKDDKPDRR